LHKPKRYARREGRWQTDGIGQAVSAGISKSIEWFRNNQVTPKKQFWKIAVKVKTATAV